MSPRVWDPCEWLPRRPRRLWRPLPCRQSTHPACHRPDECRDIFGDRCGPWRVPSDLCGPVIQGSAVSNNVGVRRRVCRVFHFECPHIYVVRYCTALNYGAAQIGGHSPWTTPISENITAFIRPMASRVCGLPAWERAPQPSRPAWKPFAGVPHSRRHDSCKTETLKSADRTAVTKRGTPIQELSLPTRGCSRITWRISSSCSVSSAGTPRCGRLSICRRSRWPSPTHSCAAPASESRDGAAS